MTLAQEPRPLRGLPTQKITLLAVAEHIRLHLADATTEVPVGNLLALDGAVAHDVEGLKQSVFLLTIAWHES